MHVANHPHCKHHQDAVLLKSPFYLTKNLSSGQLPHVLWRCRVGLLISKKGKKEKKEERKDVVL